MKRNPVVTVGAILVRPAGLVTELTPVRLRTLSGICRKLMAPGLYRDQEKEGRSLLKRLLGRADKPFALEVVIGVLLAARLCDQDIDSRVRAVVAVAGIDIDPGDYPVKIFHDPFDCDFADADEFSALVATLVQTSDEAGMPPLDSQTSV